MDEQVLIETPRGKLVGMLHRPSGPPRGPGVVFCHAFGEERKSSALVMARLARAVAAAGRFALRFDYYGCGDSEGKFVEATGRTRLDDVRAATEFLRREAGGKEFVLLGLRMGATLAARAAEELPACAGLVLIEPLADGTAYFSGQIRRSLVRRMLTRGRAGDASPDDSLRSQLTGDTEIIDLDGFAVTAETYRELGALGICAGAVTFRGPVLVCQVHFNDTARPDMEAVCEAYRRAGTEVSFARIVLPPFWSRIEITLAPELDAAVHAWLAR
jgi:exosortase A-associated hydrolase 2